MVRFLISLLLLMVVSMGAAFSQGKIVTISGPTEADIGTTYQYDVVWMDNGTPTSPPTGGTYKWTVYGGTNWSSGPSIAFIEWTNGSGFILYEYSTTSNYYYATLNVSSSSCAMPPSTGFSISSSTCPPRQLSYTGTPPSGLVWYWQTSASGTSTANSSTTYNVTAAGTYYVRAYNPSNSCWSNSSASYSVSTVSSAPATPATPTADTNLCGSKALFQSTPPPGVTWYWQGTNPNGTSTVNSGTDLAFASGTYYLRARDNTSGCWSLGSSSISVTINDAPPAPATPATTANECGPQTLTKVGSPPGNVTWYWQGTNSNGTDYTSSTATADTYIANTTDTYYLRARHSNGCWSYSIAYVDVTVNQIPATPNTPTVSTNICGPKTLTPGSPPSGVTWYWQGTNPNGTSTENSSSTSVIATEGTYYIRARNNAGGCWSINSSSVHVYINDIPAAPPVPAVTSNCGPRTLSTVGSPSGGASWYWQGVNPNGTDNTSAAATGDTYTVSNTGTYYLRAFLTNSSGGCWSSPSSVSVTVITPPPSPSYPVAETNVCGPKALFHSTPPPGETWYWQGTNPEGTSIENSGTGLAEVSGTYYLRAQDDVTGCWSINSTSVYVTIYDVPSAPTVNGNTRIGPGSLTFSIQDVAAGETYEWLTPSGTIIAENYSTPHVDASTQDYAQVRTINSSGCESALTHINVILIDRPIITASSGYSAFGNPVTLETGEYDAYQWKRNGIEIPENDIEGQYSRSITTTIQGDYTVTVLINGVGYGTSLPFNIGEQLADLNMNFIISNQISVENVLDASQVNDLSIEERSQTIEYFDGLGRPLQTVVTQGSPGKMDIVQPVVYDHFGRQFRKYLPFVPDQSTGENTGRYKDNSSIIHADPANGDYIGMAVDFYDKPFSAIADDDGDKPFAQTVFEPSPLNRVLEQGAPGALWQPGTGNTIKKAYQTNSSGEVRLWTYTLPSTAHPLGLVESAIPYAENELFKNVATDEHGMDVIEYVDKEGRTVLKRVQAVDDLQTGEAPPVNDTNYASTYYIYDDFGQLVCVIQPEGVKKIASYLSATDPDKETFLQQWAFRYRYDERRRMILKQIPGADSVVMVYDVRDRLVLTQDGNQRDENEWLFTKYDELNRPVMTGIYTHGAAITQKAMAGQLSTTNLSETFDGNTVNHGYTNVAFPRANLEPLTVTYYDNYDFTSLVEFDGDFAFQPNELPVDGDLPGQDGDYFDRVKTLVTGTKTKVLDNETWLCTANYYDDKYHVIQTTSDNLKGGFTRVSNVYDFVGKMLRTKTLYSTPDDLQHAQTSIVQRYSYDHAGRLLKTWHRIGTSTEVLLSSNEYNELGELVTKNLHETGSEEFLQSIDYRYNIRGWLKQINNPLNSVSDDLFSMALRYDDPTASGGEAQYNGNISEAIWKSAGLDKQSYGYGYDAMNRIKEGLYYNLANPIQNGRYNEKIGDPDASPSPLPGYDLNGNIQNLMRNGKTADGIYGLMDNLHYDYSNSGNRLMYVSDGESTGAAEEGFKELSGGEGTTDFSYDENGNLLKDENKGIIAIEYNFLNLPSKVSKSPTEYIVYTYDAAGRKLSQQVFGSEAKTTEYVGELVFEDNALQFIQHPEGRVVADLAIGAPDPWEYQYFLKDHLGNTRIVFNENKNTAEYVTTLEDNTQAEDMAEFSHYPSGGARSSLNVFDHTDAGTASTRSMLLHGGSNSQVGLARSFEVNPGDVFDLEVYAKYEEPTATSASVDGLLTQLISAFSLGSATSPLDGAAAYSAFEDVFPGGVPWIDEDLWDDTAPKAYLNYILFDENFIMVDFGFDQISIAGEQELPGPAVAHDYLSLHVQVQQKGYLYVYLSNEQPAQTNVYFDDMKILYYSAVEQVSDYYPFGLTFNSYQRDNSVDQRWKFQGQEHIDDLGLNWDSFKWRNHQSDIGRFFNVDPLAEKYYYNSPYAFSANKVVSHVELEGLEPIGFQFAMYYSTASPRAKRNIEAGLMIGGGTIAIVATAGSATPFIAAAGVIGGSSSVAFGSAKLVANNAEGGEDFYDQIPNTTLGFVGKAADHALANENGEVENTLDIANNALLLGVGMSEPSSGLGTVDNLLTAISLTSDVKKALERASEANSRNDKDSSKKKVTSSREDEIQWTSIELDQTEVDGIVNFFNNAK